MWSALVLPALTVSSASPTRGGDTNEQCSHWADLGECAKNPSFMLSSCAHSCSMLHLDTAPPSHCESLAARGGCMRREGVSECAATCLAWISRQLTEDREGNCWYWSTDGECDSNPTWMNSTCERSCSKLRACTADPASELCARPFECPARRDTADGCIARASARECRAGQDLESGVWRWAPAVRECALSCVLLDPPSVSRTVMRPIVKWSSLIDEETSGVHTGRCLLGPDRLTPLLSSRCPNQRWQRIMRISRRCPRSAPELYTPRWVPSAEQPRSSLTPTRVPPSLPTSSLPTSADALGHTIRLQTIVSSPRVRLLHNFVTAAEAEHLISLGGPGFHRSSTARGGGDEVRTSYSATLPMRDAVVIALRQRIARYANYPVDNLEPLQAVRYRPGELYKPHHDYYNSCETWQSGNRHFTFLVYLNEVEEGGETAFPMLNLTVTPIKYAALVFNNCLDNGDPDERSQHEGRAPARGVKYAINGWMRSKALNNAFTG